MSVLRKKKRNRLKRKRTRGLPSVSVPLATVGRVIGSTLLLAFMGFSFIFGHDYLTQCSYFKADQLTVTGNRRLTPVQVLEQAGIQKGDNILGLNLSLARKRLLAHPWIAGASVSRQLPAAIVVRIREHTPLAVLDLGRAFVINTHGEIFKELDESDHLTLPVVKGLTFSDITVGDKPGSAPFHAVMAVLQLGRERESILPNRKIRMIDVDREIGLTLVADDRIRSVRIGYADYPQKFETLQNVVSYLNRRQTFTDIDSVDLNNLNRIVVTPAQSDASDSDRKEV